MLHLTTTPFYFTNILKHSPFCRTIHFADRFKVVSHTLLYENSQTLVLRQNDAMRDYLAMFQRAAIAAYLDFGNFLNYQQELLGELSFRKNFKSLKKGSKTKNFALLLGRKGGPLGQLPSSYNVKRCPDRQLHISAGSVSQVMVPVLPNPLHGASAPSLLRLPHYLRLSLY